jgi:hypothetical protein
MGTSSDGRKRRRAFYIRVLRAVRSVPTGRERKDEVAKAKSPLRNGEEGRETPGNNSEIEKRLLDGADELRANSRRGEA